MNDKHKVFKNKDFNSICYKQQNIPIPSSIYWKLSRLMSAEAKAVLNMSIVPGAEGVDTILTAELGVSLVESLVSPKQKQHN